jgi:hypothetical protein
MQVRRRPSESSSCRLPGNLLPHGTCGRLWGQQAEAQRAASRVEEDRQGRRPASRPCHLSAVTRDKGSQPASQPMAALSRRVRAAPLPPYPGPISSLDPVQARRTLQRTPLTNRTLMSVNSLRSSRRVWPCAHSAGWRPVSLSHAVPSHQPAERPARRSPCSALLGWGRRSMQRRSCSRGSKGAVACSSWEQSRQAGRVPTAS